MNTAQRNKFFGLWKQCKDHLQQGTGMTNAEVEQERQELLKIAGAKPDKNGRYSANNLTNDGISTAMDFMETSILGRPNKKRRSNSKIYAIEQLGLDDLYLDKISTDTFNTSNWRNLTIEQLTKLQMTAKRAASQLKKA